jgi:hypothetical protein
MQDLKIAKKTLYHNDLTLAIVKDGTVLFQTDAHRISGFLHAIDQFGLELQGATVADRVAGKALALLCVYAGIKQVYAEVLSKKAEDFFRQNNVWFEWKELVDNVLDMNKTGICPFEKVAADISDPKESYVAFKALLERMKTCR